MIFSKEAESPEDPVEEVTKYSSIGLVKMSVRVINKTVETKETVQLEIKCSIACSLYN